MISRSLGIQYGKSGGVTDDAKCHLVGVEKIEQPLRQLCARALRADGGPHFAGIRSKGNLRPMAGPITHHAITSTVVE